MTFDTNQKNSFKKDPLRGLEYNKSVKPFNFVKGMIYLLLTCMIVAMAFKMCTDEPTVIPLNELNADRR